MIEHAVDLSRFTRLKELYLDLIHVPFNELATSLVSNLSTIVSHQLEKVNINYDCTHALSLNSALAGLNGLKPLDAILSLPKFPHLRRVQFEFEFLIVTQEHEIISLISPPTSSNATSLELDHNRSTDGRVFRRYLKDVVLSKIKEELEQLNSRGILTFSLVICL